MATKERQNNMLNGYGMWNKWQFRVNGTIFQKWHSDTAMNVTMMILCYVVGESAVWLLCA